MKKILVVDDLAVNRKLLRMLIKYTVSDKNLKIEEAENGVKAMEMIKTSPFDIVFMDIKMPFISGDEVAKIIKTNDPLLNVVAVSACDPHEFQDIFDDYIQKPVEVELLKQVLYKYKCINYECQNT